MQRLLIAASLVLLVFAAAPAGAADEDVAVAMSAGVSIGVKVLDAGWEPLGDQVVFVASLTIGGRDWPVHFALDYVSASDVEYRTTFPFLLQFCCSTNDIEAESKTSEWDLGVRRVWRPDKAFRPYAGGGIAFIKGSLRIDSQSFQERGSTTGYWLDVGFRRPLAKMKKMEWGVDIRHSEGMIDLGNSAVEAGGTGLSIYYGGKW